MMTQKQCDKLQADEAALMADWNTRWQEQHAEYLSFNEDGIVDYERWAALPDGKHILVLLKETNGLQGSLVECLRHGSNGKTWKTLVVSMPHPNRSDRRWTLELEKVLRITGRR